MDMDNQQSIFFGIVGSGTRAQAFIRTAAAFPERFQVTGVVVRDAGKRIQAAERWRIPVYEKIDEMIDCCQLDFVVLCIPASANVEYIKYLAARNVPVLTETPPAGGVEELIELNSLVSQGAKVQVAEQYHLRPMHAARLQVCRSGMIGSVHYAAVSVGHGYHGISLMRKMLGIHCENAEISGVRLAAKMLAGPNRQGLPSEEVYKGTMQDIAIFNFGDKVGILDFTPEQYFSWIRSIRVTVYGDRGELQNSEVAYMSDSSTPVRMEMKRIGENGNSRQDCLLGICAGDRWIYRNPFIPGRLSDDEIAIASCLQGMIRYLKTGEHLYSLAEASQDQYLALMMRRALQDGDKVKTTSQLWAFSS
jgi:predicted dehydrogenase